MDIVRNTASAVKNMFNSPTRQADEFHMAAKFEQKTPSPREATFVTNDQYESPKEFRNFASPNDLAGIPNSVLRKMVASSRRNYRRERRARNELQRENEEMCNRRRELLRDHQQQRREYQDLRQKHQELSQEHGQLRREHQDLRRAHQGLRRAHQELGGENQELQCVHDEAKQELAAVRSENRKLRDGTERERMQSANGKQPLKADRSYYESRYNYILKQIILPYAEDNGLTYNENHAANMNVVLGPLGQIALQAKTLQTQIETLPVQLQESQAEAEVLRHQVRELQKEMLARVEKTQAISDEQFAQEFRALSANVKSLSRSVRPTQDINIFHVLDSGVLFLDTKQRHWKIRTNQKYYIEVWIWSALLEMVFETPFSVYGGDANGVWGNNWEALYGDSHEGGLPYPTASSESYRCTVVGELARLTGRETIIQGQGDAHLHNMRGARRLATGVLECRNEVANVIGRKLATISSTVDVSQIPTIIDRAFALALDMSLQKCRLQLTYPAIGAVFKENSMSPMPDLDGEDVDDGVVAFIVNPGLTKWGDAHGKMLDQRYDIVPSLVQLQRHEKVVGVKPELF
ncbi:hypothetical protein EKO04_001345 [Ascochyta lentis]|uniref:Uncharacterized protein n=1 Tax=Ascochyta lentis TaxID=205686 RepID=A0A8H7JD20_9PLEO|nr:hypothetical protein EKO04_001345 [Ascochyta lentis]